MIQENEIYYKFFSDKDKPDVMFDGSLILHRQYVDGITNFITKERNNFTFYISSSFLDALESQKLDYYINYYGIFNYDIETSLGKIHEIIDYLKIYEIDISKKSEEKEYSYFYENLSKLNLSNDIKEFIFEEWVFLQEFSYIVGAYKKIFNTFKKCGAVIVDYGKKAWEFVINNYDNLVRKEFRIPDNNIVANIQRLHYLGKWVGRNWPELLMTQPHLIFPALGLRILTGLILSDP